MNACTEGILSAVAIGSGGGEARRRSDREQEQGDYLIYCSITPFCPNLARARTLAAANCPVETLPFLEIPRCQEPFFFCKHTLSCLHRITIGPRGFPLLHISYLLRNAEDLFTTIASLLEPLGRFFSLCPGHPEIPPT